MNTVFSFFAVCVGASLGASLRFGFNLAFHSLSSWLPLGTLGANLLGAYLIGIAVSFFGFFPEISPQWRLFIVTGFLGALTTFSSFSAEIFALLQVQKFLAACLAVALHVGGSLFMTFLGFSSFFLFRAVFLR